MFDISWGEIAVLGAVGVAVTGKRDLPNACRFVGHQLGRVVGLLQGARARADRFTHHNELKALQNELRSGLRELDQVKTELAVAASSRGVMGKSLGAMTPSANRIKPDLANTNYTKRNPSSAWKTRQTPPASLQNQPALTASPPSFPTSEQRLSSGNSSLRSGTASATDASLSLSDFDFQIEDTPSQNDVPQQQQHQIPPRSVHEPELSPVVQSERAVMEEEWTKQGIGFKAQAEMGSWNYSEGSSNFDDESIVDTTRATGSELLEHLERQCLIFDQYDRVVGEQEKEMEERVERIQNERKNKKDGDKEQ